jgi:Cu2+-exporting ATPase
MNDSPSGVLAAEGRHRRARREPKPSCRHCGAPLIDERMVETGFCCAGCSYVYRLIHEHGLTNYYDIKDTVTAPADVAVFEPRDFTWLDAAQHGAEASEAKVPELMLDVQGISCAACVWLIERLANQEPGARDVVVNAQYGTLRLRWTRGVFSAAQFARKLQGFGYVLGPAGESVAEPETRGLVRRIGLCAAFAMNVMLYSLPAYFGMEPTFEWAGLFGLLSLAFGTLSFLVGGLYFIGRAVRALRQRAMHIDLPIALGIVGAYGGSLYGWFTGHDRFVYFDFVSTFILLMLIGRWAQTAAVERNRRRLLSQQPRPQSVRLVSGEAVAPEKVKAADRLLIRSGQALPVEATLESAQAEFSLASINGEPEPRFVRAGERVPAGAVNVTLCDLRLTAAQSWNESLLAQLQSAGERAAETHPWLERVVRGYIAGILIAAVVSGIGWWVGTHDLLKVGAVVTAVLVVSCPCAIGLAFPLADEMATVALRRRGVFVREADLWARLGRVRKVVFDKTGTLTLETPVLVNPEALQRLSSEERAALLALVAENPHPISACLRQELLACGGVEPLAGEVHETVGFGVELGLWSLGRAGWKAGVVSGDTVADADTVLARGGVLVARFRFADRVRSDARREVEALKQAGLEVFVLSGDRSEKVRILASELGLPVEQAFGDATPETKAAWVEKHGADDALMLGDGANDSLAFDRALCRGTPVVHRGVLERKADFFYLGRGVGGVRALFAVDRLRRRAHAVILVFSVVYNLAAVGLAVAGLMSPLLAAVLMPLNSLLTLALVTGGMRRAFRIVGQ